MNDGVKGRAQMFRGVWLPASEVHMVEWMTSSKRAHTQDGKACYQFYKIEAAIAMCPPERRRVCVDVGGHVGLWAMWLVKAFGHVHSFEPTQQLAELYPLNVDMTRATLHRIGLGDRRGFARMAVDPVTTGNSHVGQFITEEEGLPAALLTGEPAPAWTPIHLLDEFDIRAVDLLKIDTEGYELPVVRGARETLLRERPRVVVEQKGYEVRYRGGESQEAVKYLEGLGMRVVKVISGDFFMEWA